MPTQRVGFEKRGQADALLGQGECLFAGVEHGAAGVGHERRMVISVAFIQASGGAIDHRGRAVGQALQAPQPGRLVRVALAAAGDQMPAYAVEDPGDAARVNGHEAQGAGAEPGFALVVAGLADAYVVVA